ncbi:hypothetical protein Vafri_3668 [Volvox africanus]|uniref:Uncharacterized protein n=1 Tax=Volvox africanus TaxID=51714 RepID=A0A8J4ETY4_9CHLO|nr:hypothetical protein Vafri_3668 [Volvox africanus]
MCCNDPGGRPINRFGRGWPPHLGPHPSHRMRRLASLAAASAPIATAAVASVANASQATASSPPSPSRSPSPLASATAVPPNALMELLGPHLSQLTVQWLTAAGSHAQRLLEGHLAELYQEGCPATSALLRAHMYGAAVQVATLGFATRLLMLVGSGGEQGPGCHPSRSGVASVELDAGACGADTLGDQSHRSG